MASDSARAGVRDAMSQDEKRPGRGSIVNKHGIKKSIFIAGGYGIMCVYILYRSYICIYIHKCELLYRPREDKGLSRNGWVYHIFYLHRKHEGKVWGFGATSSPKYGHILYCGRVCRSGTKQFATWESQVQEVPHDVPRCTIIKKKR